MLNVPVFLTQNGYSNYYILYNILVYLGELLQKIGNDDYLYIYIYRY